MSRDKTDARLHYFSDARTSPGLFYQGKRIAWWPASVKVTEERVLNMFSLWEARKETNWLAKPKALTRKEILAELQEIGL